MKKPQTLARIEALEPPIVDDVLGPALRFLQALHEVALGDLEKHLILMAIASRATAHPDFARLTNAERERSDAVFPSRGVNVRSIAESTGVARETVRRKVAEMLELGWIAREDTNLHFTARGYRELRGGRAALERLAADCHDLVRRRLVD